MWTKIHLHIGTPFVSAKNKNRGRASPGGGGPDLLRQGLHHQAQVHGGEHRGGAARVHYLEEGGQDAQLRHRARWHQVGGDWGSKVTRLTQFGLTQQTEVTFHKKSVEALNYCGKKLMFLMFRLKSCKINFKLKSVPRLCWSGSHST